jgi:hypothetical protein
MPNTTIVMSKKNTKEVMVLVLGLDVINVNFYLEPRMRFELTIFPPLGGMLYP